MSITARGKKEKIIEKKRWKKKEQGGNREREGDNEGWKGKDKYIYVDNGNFSINIQISQTTTAHAYPISKYTPAIALSVNSNDDKNNI